MAALSENRAVQGALMRLIPVCLFCLIVGGCALISDPIPLEVGPQPDEKQLATGIAAGIKDSQFATPIEITDLLRSPSSFEEEWMVCIRSASSDEARRLTYSVFFGTNVSKGLKGQFVKSRYSVFADNCNAQMYHPYTAPIAPPSTTPVADVEPIKRGRHHHQEKPAG